MDKEGKDDFTFAKLSDLNLHVTFRMSGITRLWWTNLLTECIVQIWKASESLTVLRRYSRTPTLGSKVFNPSTPSACLRAR